MSQYKPKHSKVCTYCGNLFKPKYPNQIYCSKIHPYVCSVCGNTFDHLSTLQDVPIWDVPGTRIDINTDTTVIEIAEQTYSASYLTPEPKVTLSGKILKAGYDFTCIYSRNLEPGEARVKIIGTGRYTGSVEGVFSIVPADIADCVFQFIPDQKCESDEYTKIELYPKTHVRMKSKVFARGRDYTVEYAHNFDPGTGTITYRGTGSYLEGTYVQQFEIEDVDTYQNVYVAPIADHKFTGTAIKPKPQVFFKNQLCLEGLDYTLSYRSNVQKGVGTVVIKSKNTHRLADGTLVKWADEKLARFRIV